MCIDAYDDLKESDDFQNYVKKWINEVDKGGLKILQEQPFLLLETSIYAEILHQS